MTKLQISQPKAENFEEILDALGGFGRFQFLILVLLLSFEIPASWITLSPIYVGAPPDPSSWLCNGIPIDYNVTSSICKCNGTLTSTAAKMSIVAEWGLVCNAAWVSDFITSLQMLGMLFGNIYSSQLSDWYGRRYVFLGVTVTLGLGSAVSAVAPNPYVYVFARFLCGIGFSGTLGLGAVYTIEFMPADWRALCGCVGPFGVATMAIGLLAYLIQPWRSFVWAATAPLVILVIFPFIPESPRWLLNHQKVEEAHKVLKYMARINRTEPIDMDTLQRISNNEAMARPAGDGENATEKRFSYFDFFRSKDLRLTSICLMLIWFAFAMVYFGVSYNIKNVPGDRYWNGFYLGVPDTLGFPAALLVLNRFGRRVSVFLSMSIAALFLVVLAVLQLSMDLKGYPFVILTLSLLGKFGIAMTRSATRCLSSESFPTRIRTMGMGVCGIAASFGGILAPQLAYLGSIEPSIPFFVFAIISVGGSLSAFLMKETNGQPLQDQIARKKSRRISINSIVIPIKTCVQSGN